MAYLESRIERYTLEITAKAHSIGGRCQYLLSQDYSTDAPTILAKTIVKICQFMEAVAGVICEDNKLGKLETESSLKYLKNIDYVLRVTFPL